MWARKRAISSLEENDTGVSPLPTMVISLLTTLARERSGGEVGSRLAKQREDLAQGED